VHTGIQTNAHADTKTNTHTLSLSHTRTSTDIVHGAIYQSHDDRADPEPEEAVGRPSELSTAGTKMLVSNLGPEVTDEDLEELFQEHGGPIKKAEIFYKQACVP
jgi:hypothetical protein